VLVICAALAAGLGFHLAQRQFDRAPASAPVVDPDSLRAVRLVHPPRPLADWRLQRHDGRTIGPADLRGHWTLVFLGFTHCPDVCPTTLQELSRAQRQWQALPEARRPRLLFVSVDPERDTPERTGTYAHFFHPDTWAATADAAPLQQFAETLGLVYMKVPIQGGYSMDHSSTLVLLDPQGRMAGLVRPPLDPAAIGADLARLAEASP
jgi:protein SCO1/2